MINIFNPPHVLQMDKKSSQGDLYQKNLGCVHDAVRLWCKFLFKLLWNLPLHIKIGLDTKTYVLAV